MRGSGVFRGSSAGRRSAAMPVVRDSSHVKRSALALLAALVLGACAAAPAEAWFTLGLDSTEAGQIAFWAWGSGTFTSVDVSERVQDSDVPVRASRRRAR